jgi:hypothetical protein
MRFTSGLDHPHLVDAVRRKAPTGCCGKVFTSAKLYEYHAITCKKSSSGGSPYNTHNGVIRQLAAVCHECGVPAHLYGSGMTYARQSEPDSNGDTLAVRTDIAFPDMPFEAFDTAYLLGNGTIRSVVGTENNGNTLVVRHSADTQAGGALKNAETGKQKK